MALLSSQFFARTTHARVRSCAWAVLASVVLWCSAGPALAAGPPAPAPPAEYQVKAAFLFNFTQFVEWPPTAFPEAGSPLIIGVLGADPFGPYLDNLVRGESRGTHPIQVVRYQQAEEIEQCHILFVGQREAGQLDAVFARLKNRSILTVGDFKGFALRGGMIRFLTVNNKIRLRVNLEAAKAAGLVLSSKLLRPAEVVTTGNP